MFTTRPRDAFRVGRHAWTSAIGATTFTSTTRRRTSSGYSSSGGSGEVPSSEALFTRRSNRARRRTRVATRRRCGRLATSPATARTVDPAARNLAAASSRGVLSRAVMMRVHPWRAKNSARVSPSPRLAPVIKAARGNVSGSGTTPRPRRRFINLHVYKIYKEPPGPHRARNEEVTSWYLAGIKEVARSATGGRQAPGDGGADLAPLGGAAQVVREDLALREHGGDRGLHAFGGGEEPLVALPPPEPLEHHLDRQDHRDRVHLVLARVLRGAPVDRLEH